MKQKLRDYFRKPISSPPARGRGLKLELAAPLDPGQVSPPARGRGLKLCISTGAAGCLFGRPPRGGVD